MCKSCRGLLTQPAGHFVPVHPRHPEVEEDRRRAERLRQFKRRGAVVGDRDLVAL